MNLPRDVYEAAAIDGANSVQIFFKITLPLLKSTTLFIVITSLISYLQAYVQILVMTEGGPGTSTYTISYLTLIRPPEIQLRRRVSSGSCALPVHWCAHPLRFKVSGDSEELA